VTFNDNFKRIQDYTELGWQGSSVISVKSAYTPATTDLRKSKRDKLLRRGDRVFKKFYENQSYGPSRIQQNEVVSTPLVLAQIPVELDYHSIDVRIS
jgi:hypothetical protein